MNYCNRGWVTDNALDIHNCVRDTMHADAVGHWCHCGAKYSADQNKPGFKVDHNGAMWRPPVDAGNQVAPCNMMRVGTKEYRCHKPAGHIGDHQDGSMEWFSTRPGDCTVCGVSLPQHHPECSQAPRRPTDDH